MTDLSEQLARLLDGEPEAPYDIDQIVRSGRRARRRRNVALAAASTAGAAGLTAAVAIPVLSGGGNDASVGLAARPSPSPSPTARPATCYLVSGPPHALKRNLDRLVRSGRVGEHPSLSTVKHSRYAGRRVVQVCSSDAALAKSGPDQTQNTQPAGPPYSYTEEPAAIASRLGAHLHDRVVSFGLSITYTRPFSQESSNLDGGHPSYFGGNVDVHEASGYADIGVQVTHEVTELVPFTSDCTAAEHCVETKLPDGSVLRTGQVNAGPNAVVVTAEVHCPNGVVVQAQESNYPFGPDAGSQQHGDQPLTLDQLVSLARDAAFTF